MGVGVLPADPCGSPALRPRRTGGARGILPVAAALRLAARSVLEEAVDFEATLSSRAAGEAEAEAAGDAAVSRKSEGPDAAAAAAARRSSLSALSSCAYSSSAALRAETGAASPAFEEHMAHGHSNTPSRGVVLPPSSPPPLMLALAVGGAGSWSRAKFRCLSPVSSFRWPSAAAGVPSKASPSTPPTTAAPLTAKAGQAKAGAPVAAVREEDERLSFVVPALPGPAAAAGEGR